MFACRYSFLILKGINLLQSMISHIPIYDRGASTAVNPRQTFWFTQIELHKNARLAAEIRFGVPPVARFTAAACPQCP